MAHVVEAEEEKAVEGGRRGKEQSARCRRGERDATTRTSKYERRNTDRPPHTYTTRNENIPASFGLLSAIKRIPPLPQPRTKRATRPKQDPNLSARIGRAARALKNLARDISLRSS